MRLGGRAARTRREEERPARRCALRAAGATSNAKPACSASAGRRAVTCSLPSPCTGEVEPPKPPTQQLFFPWEAQAPVSPHHWYTSHVLSLQHACAHWSSEEAEAEWRPSICTSLVGTGKVHVAWGAAVGGPQVVGESCIEQYCQAWQPMSAAHTEAQAAAEVFPRGASIKPCINELFRLIGNLDASWGRAGTNGRSPRWNSQLSFQSTSLRSAVTQVVRRRIANDEGI